MSDSRYQYQTIHKQPEGTYCGFCAKRIENIEGLLPKGYKNGEPIWFCSAECEFEFLNQFDQIVAVNGRTV